MRRVLLTVITAAVLVGLTASPSMAQTKQRNDARGDAPRATDIRSVKIQNNKGKFAATISMADVTKRKTGVVVLSSRTNGAGAFSLEAVPVSKGRFSARGFVIDGDGDVTRIPQSCIGGKYLVGDNGFFRFVVPQRCLGPAAGRVETGVLSYDKQKAQSQQSGRAILRKGDADDAGDADAPAGGDVLGSTVTTRRG